MIRTGSIATRAKLTAPVALEVLSDLIGSIYDCALDPTLWPQTLTALRQALGYANAAISLHELPSCNVIVNATSGIEGPWLETLESYGPDVVEQWGGVEAVYRLPIDEPVVLSSLRTREQMLANRYFVEWARPQGITDVIGFLVQRDAGMLGTIGMGRHFSAGDIDSHQIEAVRLLMPHFQRAVTISRVLDMQSIEEASFAAALDALSAPVLLVDAELKIVHANRAAEAMLRIGDPLASSDGTLVLRARDRQHALGSAVRQAALAEATMGRRGYGIPAPRSDGTPALLHVLPLGYGSFRRELSPDAAAAIFITSAGSTPLAASDAMSAMFDLTAAEARVFSHIAAGTTLSETASRLGVSPGTAKTHLLRVFLKTGTHRQAELVRLAASLMTPG